MLPKKYIGVDANNINLIMNVISDDKDGKIKYTQPRINSFTKGNATEIFERNNIPAEYQKMFMIVNNNMSMAFQKMLLTLYKVETNTINYHIKKIYSDNELSENSTIRKFRIVQKEGNREVSRDVVHYNLQMIIALGFKVDNERAVQFRKWVNGIVKENTIKGYALDDERLKNRGSILTEKYKVNLNNIE